MYQQRDKRDVKDTLKEVFFVAYKITHDLVQDSTYQSYFYDSTMLSFM